MVPTNPKKNELRRALLNACLLRPVLITPLTGVLVFETHPLFEPEHLVDDTATVIADIQVAVKVLSDIKTGTCGFESCQALLRTEG